MTPARLPDGERHTLATIAARCTEEGDCLLWDGALCHGVRPVAKMGGKMVNLRRYIFTELLSKPVPAGMEVSFTCDQPRCVEGEHLGAMTRSEIIKRSAERTGYGSRPDRSAKLARAAQARSPHGWEVVRRVREAEGTNKAVARAMGLPKTFVNNVRMNLSWKPTTAFSGLGARPAASNDSNERKRA